MLLHLIVSLLVPAHCHCMELGLAIRMCQHERIDIWLTVNQREDRKWTGWITSTRKVSEGQNSMSGTRILVPQLRWARRESRLPEGMVDSYSIDLDGGFASVHLSRKSRFNIQHLTFIVWLCCGCFVCLHNHVQLLVPHILQSSTCTLSTTMLESWTNSFTCISPLDKVSPSFASFILFSYQVLCTGKVCEGPSCPLP